MDKEYWGFHLLLETWSTFWKIWSIFKSNTFKGETYFKDFWNFCHHRWEISKSFNVSFFVKLKLHQVFKPAVMEYFFNKRCFRLPFFFFFLVSLFASKRTSISVTLLSFIISWFSELTLWKKVLEKNSKFSCLVWITKI